VTRHRYGLERRRRTYLVDYVGPNHTRRTVRVRSITVGAAKVAAAAAIRRAVGPGHRILGVREP